MPKLPRNSYVMNFRENIGAYLILCRTIRNDEMCRMCRKNEMEAKITEK